MIQLRNFRPSTLKEVHQFLVDVEAGEVATIEEVMADRVLLNHYATAGAMELVYPVDLGEGLPKIIQLTPKGEWSLNEWNKGHWAADNDDPDEADEEDLVIYACRHCGKDLKVIINHAQIEGDPHYFCGQSCIKPYVLQQPYTSPPRHACVYPNGVICTWEKPNGNEEWC